MKKPKKTLKSARENHFLPVKFSENHTREKQIYGREKYRKLHPWNGKNAREKYDQKFVKFQWKYLSKKG